MQELDKLSTEIEGAGGQILVVTSESQTYADSAKKKWKLPSLRMLGDPSISLARHLKKSGMLDVFISMPDLATEEWTARHPFMRSYTNGVPQPATLVVSKEKDVWFAHAVVPNMYNGGGAVDRPYLRDVWEQVKKSKLTVSGNSSPGIMRRPRKQKLTDTSLPFVLLGALGITLFSVYRLGNLLRKTVLRRKALPIKL